MWRESLAQQMLDIIIDQREAPEPLAMTRTRQVLATHCTAHGITKCLVNLRDLRVPQAALVETDPNQGLIVALTLALTSSRDVVVTTAHKHVVIAAQQPQAVQGQQRPDRDRFGSNRDRDDDA